jgi:hypothetical protein
MKRANHQRSLEDFINNVLLRDIALMQSSPHLRYLSFGPIAAGIEFLGACTDRYPFEERARSEKRFRRGIERFLKAIDSRYSLYNMPTSPFYLYGHLRHAMLHMVCPERRIALTTREEAAKDGNAHLVIDGESGKLVLVAEDFYADFARACHFLKSRLPTLVLTNPKFRDRDPSHARAS